ncbi:hypothetical protein MUGA111182_19385 [Mucilaginibacter galii]|uniref:hypothetical protein n=1 Tax=Mucilaginibacter galii TaxID=2005073 RepID=UPI00166D914E|nr:hypothetical protein [Mucilaginibacter galii]
MKNKLKRTELSLKHLNELKEIIRTEKCPLTCFPDTDPEKKNINNFLTWLRLQCYKLDYRLLYYDVTVCCTFILFLFVSLRFNTLIVKNAWFSGVTIFLLVFSCIVFIGVHLLDHRKQKSEEGSGLENKHWENYRLSLMRGTVMIKVYLFILILCSFLFWYHESVQQIHILGWLFPVTGLLFAYGIMLLGRTILDKKQTEVYIRKAKACLDDDTKSASFIESTTS